MEEGKEGREGSEQGSLRGKEIEEEVRYIIIVKGGMSL